MIGDYLWLKSSKWSWIDIIYQGDWGLTMTISMNLIHWFSDPPGGVSGGDGQYYNPYMAGGWIAMAPPLYNEVIEYDDGTPASMSQLAKGRRHGITIGNFHRERLQSLTSKNCSSLINLVDWYPHFSCRRLLLPSMGIRAWIRWQEEDRLEVHFRLRWPLRVGIAILERRNYDRQYELNLSTKFNQDPHRADNLYNLSNFLSFQHLLLHEASQVVGAQIEEDRLLSE